MKEFDSTNQMPRSTSDTFETKLSLIETDISALANNYLFLLQNDKTKKTEYDGKVLGLETHREKILDIRLAMGISAVVENKEMTSAMPKLEPVPAPRSKAGYLMPNLSQTISEVKPHSEPATPHADRGGHVSHGASGYPRLQMQKLKAPVFDGDVCCYAVWKKQWREMVHPNCSGETEELYRMQDAMGSKDLK